MFLSESKNFDKSCVNRFQSDLISMGKTEKHFELRHQVWFVLMLYAYVSNFDGVVILLVLDLLLKLDLHLDCI